MLNKEEFVFPDFISSNSNIGVTAMSSGLNDTRGLTKLKYSVQNFANKGFKIVETPNVKSGEKLVSGSAISRVNEFCNLWKREDIPYIIVACGGEFLMETLPYLHQNKELFITSKPKWVQGFSDVSLLNFYLTTNFNFATIHANSFSSYAMIPWDKSLEMPIEFVTNKKDLIQNNFEFYEKERDRSEGAETKAYNLTEQVIYKNLYENGKNVKFEGTLIGGCIDVLKVIIGTPMDNTKQFCSKFDDGMIWYLENCEMTVTDLKRSLWQMKMAGWFDNVKGFIFGRTNVKDSVDDFSYEDALHDVLDEFNVPVIYDVDFGHVAPQWTIINGAFAEFEYNAGKGCIVQKLLKR